MKLILILLSVFSLQIKNPIDTNTSSTLHRESIEMSRAISDLGALTVMSGVLITLMLFTFGYLIFQLVSYNKKLSTIEEYSKKSLTYLNDEFERRLTATQAESVIKAYNRLYQYETVFEVIKIIKENNLQDRDKVNAKIKTYLRLSHSKLSTDLKKFSFAETTLDSTISSDWQSLIATQMNLDTLTKDFELYKLNETYSNLFIQIEIHQLNKLQLI